MESRIKGIVVNLLEEVAGVGHGNEAWDSLIESVGVDGGYTSLGNCDDAKRGDHHGLAEASVA